MVQDNNNRPVIVQAVGLTKVFKDFWLRDKARAVDGIDFEIYANEIFGLLGPNGSGKSTTIKMILGLLHVTRGKLTVFGKAPNDVSIKKRIGFLPEESYLYRFLNPRETLDYYGKLFSIDRRTRVRRIDQLLEMVGLGQAHNRPVGEFSKGMQRRIGIAQALINDPDFLILDEPTSGLDPIGTKQVKDLIIELRRRGKTILLSSHLLADVEDVCDRMVMLYGGRIRAQGTTGELLSDTDHTVIETPRLKPETISRIEEILREVEGVGIEKVSVPRQRLEQLFLEIVERARQEQVATSGAVSGGQTAEFLRLAEGEGLIDTLVAGEAETQQKRAVERDEAARKREAESRKKDAVLEDLLRSADETEKPAPKVIEKGAAPEKPREVDDSVIDSLLGSGNDDDAKRDGN